MPICPVCKKTLRTELGLEGHMRLSGDLAHETYRGYQRPSNKRSPGRKATSRRVRSDPSTSSLQKQVQALKDELQALKEQPVQQQHQPVTTVKQFLDEEKQKNADLKDKQENERELVELLKEKMDGGVSRDREIIDNAPESIQRELQLHHLELLC